VPFILQKRACLGVCLALVPLLAFDALPARAGPAAQQSPADSQAAPARAPSASQLATARALVVACGMSRSFAIIVPQFIDQIRSSLTQTRPELSADLDAVLAEIKPEFDKQVDEMIGIAAQIYAKQMSEEDLRAAVNFFESPAGKHYVEMQPAFLTEAVTAMQGWQGKLSTDMMARVREEMKKKGHEI